MLSGTDYIGEDLPALFKSCAEVCRYELISCLVNDTMHVLKLQASYVATRSCSGHTFTSNGSVYESPVEIFFKQCMDKFNILFTPAWLTAVHGYSTLLTPLMDTSVKQNANAGACMHGRLFL